MGVELPRSSAGGLGAGVGEVVMTKPDARDMASHTNDVKAGLIIPEPQNRWHSSGREFANGQSLI